MSSLTVIEKNISDTVLNRVKELEKEDNLQFPPGYSYANALKSAYLILQETKDKDGKPALAVCSKESVANTLLNMVIQGLSPAKKQCYFVVYGNQLQLMRSYMGTISVTKRLKGVKNVVANVIYEGDEFEYILDLDTGYKKISKHEQKFDNIDNAKIKGAYAIIVMEGDEPNYIEIMPFKQIQNSWKQGIAYASGKSKAHNNFTEEMAKKTVINRACKLFANTSDDSDILLQAFNSSASADDEGEKDSKDIINNVEYEVKEEIKENANVKNIDINQEEVHDSNKAIDVEAKSVKTANQENNNQPQDGEQTTIGPDF